MSIYVFPIYKLLFLCLPETILYFANLLEVWHDTVHAFPKEQVVRERYCCPTTLPALLVKHLPKWGYQVKEECTGRSQRSLRVGQVQSRCPKGDSASFKLSVGKNSIKLTTFAYMISHIVISKNETILNSYLVP